MGKNNVKFMIEVDIKYVRTRKLEQKWRKAKKKKKLLKGVEHLHT